ncbi:putative quinol monooxygenase [Baekduia alba]|uniref:putative quinol monooxygenase n=1 Tax=Baekduia alba TaxID=2997333 RepID=UPI002340ADE5|nr:antibiotic biosynthesis monooxygenase family protein [Baekduia alba]
MSLTIHAEIHGLGGRASELRDLLAEHATRLAGADGCLGATAAQTLGADVGEYVLTTRWCDEAALRAHYATADYTYYAEHIGELLARPSDVRISYVEREVRATADLSQDPTRQG